MGQLSSLLVNKSAVKSSSQYLNNHHEKWSYKIKSAAPAWRRLEGWEQTLTLGGRIRFLGSFTKLGSQTSPGWSCDRELKTGERVRQGEGAVGGIPGSNDAKVSALTAEESRRWLNLDSERNYGSFSIVESVWSFQIFTKLLCPGKGVRCRNLTLSSLLFK